MKAVYHNDIRDELIAACAQLGEYSTIPHLSRLAKGHKLTKIEYPREAGRLPTDITAYHQDQKDWGPERHQRPDILHRYEKKGYQNPTYAVPLLIYNQAIVLDYDHQPMLDFKNLPMTLSSLLEGWLQEAISRQDSRIDVKDFRVRMPTDPKAKGSVSLPTISAISMRRSRFRWKAGYLSWTQRTGSKDIKKYLDNLLPHECKVNNNTKGFRELKASEVKLMTALNRNKHLQRAGPRSLTNQAREKMDASFWKSVATALNKEMQVEGSENSSGGLKESEDELESVSESTDENTVADNQELEMEFKQPTGADYRFVPPTTQEDVEFVYKALESSRQHYRAMTRENPPDTDRYADYASQWNTVQMSFIGFWSDRGYDADVPTLDQYVDSWTGGYPEMILNNSSYQTPEYLVGNGVNLQE